MRLEQNVSNISHSPLRRVSLNKLLRKFLIFLEAFSIAIVTKILFSTKFTRCYFTTCYFTSRLYQDLTETIHRKKECIKTIERLTNVEMKL